MNSNEDPAFSRRPAQAALSFSNFVCVCVFVFVCVHVSVSLSLSLSLDAGPREGRSFFYERGTPVPEVAVSLRLRTMYRGYEYRGTSLTRQPLLGPP